MPRSDARVRLSTGKVKWPLPLLRIGPQQPVGNTAALPTLVDALDSAWPFGWYAARVTDLEALSDAEIDLSLDLFRPPLAPEVVSLLSVDRDPRWIWAT